MSDAASAFDIAASGMAAQRAQMDVIAENLANANIAVADGRAPYRSKIAVFEPASPFSQALQLAAGDDFEIEFPALGADDDPEPRGVRLAGVFEGSLAPSPTLLPASAPPAAPGGARKGIGALSDVDPIEQMIGLIVAGRAYDANVAALQAAKQMEIEAADIGRSS